MGERKGVNKYYPPDFDYKKHGSLDRYHNTHPLRERARKLKSEGILIIRFEMPYNIWCNGCDKHIGMGVRYNAEKKKVGNYYSTIIYKFRMKCHLCDQYFEIQTDPANCEYVILSGARRKEERWDAKSNEQIEMTDHKDKKELMTNPMFKLEHAVKDKQKLHTVIPTLNEIQDIQEEKRDDYLLNKALRKTFRERKKKLEQAQESDKKLLAKSSLSIPLLKENEEDRKMSKLIKYNTVTSCSMNQESVREKIINQSIFPSLSNSKKHSSVKNDALNSSMLSQNLGIKIKKRKSSSVHPENELSPNASKSVRLTEPSDTVRSKVNASPCNNTPASTCGVITSDSNCKNPVSASSFAKATCDSLMVVDYSSSEEDA